MNLPRDWLLWVLAATSVGSAVAVVVLPSGPITRREIAMCDQTVATLLTTHDLVEIERARVLIGRLRCDVGKRLP